MNLFRRGGGTAAQATGVLLVVERKLATTLSGLLLVGLVVIGWLLGRQLESRQLLVMVYGLLLLVGLAHAIGSRRPAVVAERANLPTHIRAGQPVRCSITLTAKRRISTLVFEEALSPELGRPVRVPVPVLPAGQAVEHAFSFTAARRGVYTVGPLITEWSDPFG